MHNGPWFFGFVFAIVFTVGLIAVGVMSDVKRHASAVKDGCEYMGIARDTNVAFLKCNSEIIMRDSREYNFK